MRIAYTIADKADILHIITADDQQLNSRSL